MSDLGAGDRPRDPRPAEDADEDVLPLRERLRRRAEHADLPGLPRVPRRAAGAEPGGDRGDDQARPRARLHDRRPGRLPPEELLLSRPPEGVPDLPVRRAALLGRQPDGAGRRRRHRGRASCARTSRRTRPRTSTSPPPAGSTARRATLVDFNRGGTPLLEIVTEPELHSADDAKRFLQLLRQTVVELGLSDAELEKGSMRFDVNVSVRPAGSDELRTRCGAEEHELVQLRREGDREGDRAAGRDLRGGRDGRAGDAPLRPRQRGLAAAPQQGGGAGLPLLPGARPRAVHPPAELVERLRARGRRAAERADQADRRHALVLRRRRARHRRARPALVGRSSPRARTRRRRRTCSRTRSSPPGSTRRRVDPAELAKLVAGARRDPARGVRRGARALGRRRLLAPSRTWRRRPSATSPSSTRSSTR